MSQSTARRRAISRSASDKGRDPQVVASPCTAAGSANGTGRSRDPATGDEPRWRAACASPLSCSMITPGHRDQATHAYARRGTASSAGGEPALGADASRRTGIPPPSRWLRDREAPVSSEPSAGVGAGTAR